MERPTPSSKTSAFTAFISCAGEDKATIALPLLELLEDMGIRTFVHGEYLHPGYGDISPNEVSSEEPSMEAKIAVIVLSPEYVAGKWPMRECLRFLKRCEESLADKSQGPIVIPFFYRLSVSDLYAEPRMDRKDKDGVLLYSKTRFFERQAKNEPEANIANIKAAMRALRNIQGVPNFANANNDNSHVMRRRRESLLLKLFSTITASLRIIRSQDEVDRYEVDRYEVDPNVLERALRDGDPDRLYNVRLMVLGASSRGKTATIASLRRKPFDDNRSSTIGIDLSIHYIAIGNHRESLSEEQIEHLGKLSRFQARYREYQRRQVLESMAGGGDISIEYDESTPHSSEDPTIDASAEPESPVPLPSEVYEIANKTIEIPDFAIPDCITLRCWDFGGQPEYEVAHELFLSPRSIVMLVFDLSRFENSISREEEVLQLQHWIQTVYAATPENEVCYTFRSVVIVGTNRDTCQTSNETHFTKLRGLLIDKLDSKVTSQWEVWKAPMIAIENRIATENVQGSGLSELENHLEITAKQMVEWGAPVPLRWLAFLERLQMRYDDSKSWQSFSVDQRAVANVSRGLHFSANESEGVNTEVYNCLKYLRNLGEVVLFDVRDRSLNRNNGSYVLFPRPERILQALKVIVAPEEVRCHGLSDREDRNKMRGGILTRRAVEEKWGQLPGLSSEQERQKLLSLMTSMDIFIILKSSGSSGVYGVPSLLKTSWDDLLWLDCNTGALHEIHALTRFEGCIPLGFAGTFIGHLHRTIGNERTNVRLIRGNAVLLTTKGVQHTGEHFQIFVGFRHEKRELHWKVRGPRLDFGLIGRCLSEFEAHKRGRLSGREVGATHYILTGCPQNCSSRKCDLQFEISVEGKRWWEERYPTLAEVSSSCDIAICENIDCSAFSTLEEAIKSTGVSEKPSILPSPRRAEFEVFISHAGPDKSTMARPLYNKLKEKGVTAFLDEKELKPGEEALPKMRRAMNEAPILVAIVSPEFCVRFWPIAELKAFIRRISTEARGPVIIPLFYRLDVGKCRYLDLEKLHDNDHYSMQRFEELRKRTDKDANTEVDEIRSSMRRLADFTGIENLERASNEDIPGMRERRELLLYKVVEALTPHIRKLRGRSSEDDFST